MSIGQSKMKKSKIKVGKTVARVGLCVCFGRDENHALGEIIEVYKDKARVRIFQGTGDFAQKNQDWLVWYSAMTVWKQMDSREPKVKAPPKNKLSKSVP